MVKELQTGLLVGFRAKARSGLVIEPNIPVARGRAVAVMVTVALVGAGCAGSIRSSVPTPSGRTLDCPSELIAFSTGDLLAEAQGWSTAQAAVNAYAAIDRPSGEPSVEEETADEVVFVFTDDGGNRVGRFFVSLTENGWFVLQTEKCGFGT